MGDENIRHDILTKLSVPLWPTAGRAFGLGRSAAYRAAARGEILVNRVGGKITAPTPPLRKQLHLETA